MQSMLLIRPAGPRGGHGRGAGWGFLLVMSAVEVGGPQSPGASEFEGEALNRRAAQELEGRPSIAGGWGDSAWRPKSGSQPHGD